MGLLDINQIEQDIIPEGEFFVRDILHSTWWKRYYAHAIEKVDNILKLNKTSSLFRYKDDDLFTIVSFHNFDLKTDDFSIGDKNFTIGKRVYRNVEFMYIPLTCEISGNKFKLKIPIQTEMFQYLKSDLRCDNLNETKILQLALLLGVNKSDNVFKRTVKQLTEIEFLIAKKAY